MSKLSNRRKAMHYTVKRCATCEHYREGYVYLTTDSQTRRAKPLCRLGEFTIAAHGLCDEWKQSTPVREYLAAPGVDLPDGGQNNG